MPFLNYPSFRSKDPVASINGNFSFPVLETLIRGRFNLSLILEMNLDLTIFQGPGPVVGGAGGPGGGAGGLGRG